MSDRMKKELSININTNVNTQPIKDAEKELSSFFTKYDDQSIELGIDQKNLKIDTKDFYKAITAAKQLESSIDGVSKSAPLMMKALNKDIEFANNVKAEFKDVMATFDDGSIIRGFDDISNKISKGFAVVAVDLGGRVQYLRQQIADAISDLEFDGIEKFWDGSIDYISGNMDKGQIQARIELLKKLFDYQKELEKLQGKAFSAKEAPLGKATSTESWYIKQLESYSNDLEKYNLKTTEQLKRRKELIGAAEDIYWDEDSQKDAKTNIKDDEAYRSAIDSLEWYIQERKNAIEKLEENEDELFSVDGISKYVESANTEIERLQGCMKELQTLRDGPVDTQGVPIIGDLTEVLSALEKIESAIRGVTDAFKPLTDALSNQDSAISQMVNANIEDLQRLKNEVAATFADIKTISEKDFSSKTTNVVQQTINAPGGILKTQRAELKELAKMLAQYQSAIGDLNSKSNIFKKIGLSASGQLDFFSFDLNEVLAGLKKATTAEKLDGWADVLDDYKKGIINVANEINKIQSGLVNLDPLQNQKKKDPDIINLGQTSSNVDGILTEVKSIRDKIDAEIQGIRASFEDIFKFDSLNPNLDNITSITDKIYQQFVELQGKINSLDFTIKSFNIDSSATESSSGIITESNAMKAIADSAEKAAISKEQFVVANQSVKTSAKSSSVAAKEEAKAVEEVAKKVAKSTNGIRASQDAIIDEYKKLYSGKGKVNANLATMFNKVLDGADIDVSSIKTSFGTKSYKDDDKNIIEYDYVKLIAEGTDALGKATTVTREYEVATGGLIKKMGSFKDVKDTFDVSKEIEIANSKVAELEKRMGTFKINLTDVKNAANNITDEASLDVFEKAFDGANQKLKELKATLKSTHSLDPVTNAESMMSNLDTTVEKLQTSIKKFSNVDGFSELETSLTTIKDKIKEYNDATDGMAKAQVVQGVNKEITKFNTKLDLVKAKHTEENRVLREQQQEYSKLIQSQDKLYNAKKKLEDQEYGSADEQEWQRKVNEAQKEYDLVLKSVQYSENRSQILKREQQLQSELAFAIDERRKKEEELAWAQKEQTDSSRIEKEIDAAYKERAESVKAEIAAEKELAAVRKESEAFYRQEEKTRKAQEDAAWAEYRAEQEAAAEKERQISLAFSAKEAQEAAEAEKELAQARKEANDYYDAVEKQQKKDEDAKKVKELNALYRERNTIISSIIKYNNKANTLKTDKAIQRAKDQLEIEKQKLTTIDDEINKYGKLINQSKLAQQNDRLANRLYDSNKTNAITSEQKQDIEAVNNLLQRRQIIHDHILKLQQQMNTASGDEERKAIQKELDGQNAIYNALTKQLATYKDIALQRKVTEQDNKFREQDSWNKARQTIKSAADVDNVELESQKQDYKDVLNLVDQLFDAQTALHKINTDSTGKIHTAEREEEIKKVKELSMLLKDIYGIDIKNLRSSLDKSGLLTQEQKNNLLEKEREYKQDIVDLTAKAADKEATLQKKQQERDNKKNQNYGKTEFNRATKFLESMNANLRSIEQGDVVSESLDKLVQDYTEAYKKIATIRQKFKEDSNAANDKGLKSDFQDAVLDANNLQKKIQDIFDTTRKLENISDDIRIGDAALLDNFDPNNIKTSMIAYANAVSEGKAEILGFNAAGTEMYGIINRASGVADKFTVSFDQGTNKLHAYTTGIKEASDEWGKFKKEAVDGAKQVVGMYFGFQEAVQAVKAGVNYVKEIDLAMTELKKVTNETDGSYAQFLEDAASTSSVIGSTISDFTEATATFARLGYTMEESASMAETAIVYKNVADGLDTVEEASDSIISTMMAFGIEADNTMSIIDKYNEVGNRFAITSAGIGEALQRSASALFEAGNTIDESIALVTAANSVIQNPEQVGTALKTLALRLRGAKTELEEAGLETDNMAESTSTLQAKLQALTHGKVDIMEDADTFKSTTQILREMSEAWEDMTDIERASALELMGGKRQANILASVIKNFETVEDVIETSMNSTGSAMAENEKYLDSIQGRIDLFNNSLQKFWSNMISSDMVKGVVDAGTDLINFLDTAHGKVIALVAAVQLMAKFKGFSLKGISTSLIDTIKNITNAQQALQNLTVTNQLGDSLDPSKISSYAAAVSSLTANQQANLLASQGLSQEQIKLAMGMNQVSGAAIQEAMAQGRASWAKRDAATADMLLNQQKNMTIVASLRAQAQTASESDKVKLLAVANQIAANSYDELTEARLKSLLASQALENANDAEVIDNINAALSNLGNSATKTGGALSMLGTGLGALWKTNPVGMVLSIVSAVISLIPVITSVVDACTTSFAEIKEKAQKAGETIKSLSSEFKEDAKFVSDSAERFAELAQGVDMLTGKNLSLTTDDYEEFLGLSNQLANVFPTLSRVYDENGNAIVQLSGDTDTMVDSLNNLLDAQRQITNQKIAENLPDLYAGVKLQSDEHKKELGALKSNVDYYTNMLDSLSESDIASNISNLFDIGELQFDSSIQSSQLVQNIQNILDSLDIKTILSESIDGNGDITGYTLQLLSSASPEQLKTARDNIGAGIDAVAKEYNSKINELNSDIAKTTNDNKENWSQLSSSIASWLQTDSSYKMLNNEMQSVVQSMVNNIDFSKLNKVDTWDQMQEYIKTNIISKIQDAGPEVQEAFSKLFKIKTDDKTTGEYINSIKEQAQKIADVSDFTYDEVLKNTGYQNIIDKYETSAQDILRVLDDNIPKYYEKYEAGTGAHFRSLEKYSAEVEALKDKIYSLSPDEVTRAFDIIKKYGINTWDELVEALENKTFDVAVDLDTEKTGIDNLLAAIDESISATGLSSESVENLKARYQDLENYDPSRLFEMTTNGIHLNVKALGELEEAYEKQNKDALDEKLKGLTEQYNDLTLEIQECGDASERALLYAQRSNVIDQINDTAALAAQYEGLTSAYNKWQSAQSNGEERDMYEGVLSGKKEMDEEISRGWVDDGTRAYLELLSGKDLSAAPYKDVLDVYKQLNQEIGSSGYNVYDFFTQDESGNSTTDGIFNFFDAVMSKQKEIGENWISINEETGEYSFDFGVNGDQAIADALGISEELVQIILRAAQDAGFDINLDSAYSELANLTDEAEATNDRLKELGATEYTFNINSTDIDQVQKQIEEAKAAIKNLQNEDGTLKVGVSETDYQNAKTLLATLIYQKQTLDESIVLNVDTSAINEGDIKEEIQALLDYKAAYNDFEVKTAIGVDTTEAQQKLDEAKAKLSELPEEHLTTLNIDLSKTPEQINADISNITKDALLTIGVNDSAILEYQNGEYNTEGTVTWKNNIDAVTAWMAEAHIVDGTVDWGNDTTDVKTHFSATGTINWSGDGVVNGTAHVSGTAHANGSWGAKKTETSLVGELGPEILVRNGRWQTVGENGAEFTQVKKGDIIFNHKQTEELLKNGYVTGRGKAYASGTAYSNGGGPGRHTITSASVKENGSNKSNNTSLVEDAKDAAEEFKEVFDWIEVRLEEITEDLDLKNAKLENAVGSSAQNAIIDDMIETNEKLYKNLIAGSDEYHAFAKKLLAKVPEAYRQAAQDGSIAIETFTDEASKETIEAIQEYRDWVQKGADATQQAEETLTEISNLAKQAIDNIATDYDNKTSLGDGKIEQLDAYNALSETDLGAESAKIYEAIIKENNKNIDILREQRNAMLAELNKQVEAGNIEKYSQNWYDAINEISEVDTKIIELTTDTEDYQDSINELHWDHFDNLLTRLEAISNEAENLIDILGSKDLVDKDTAEWTDDGITSLGLYAQQMEAAEVQAKKYEEEISYLNKNWKKLGYTEQEYVEKLDELKSGQYDAIKAYNDTKNAIVDLNKERVDAIRNGIEKEIESYKKLIDTKKKELETEKD